MCACESIRKYSVSQYVKALVFTPWLKGSRFCFHPTIIRGDDRLEPCL